MYLFDDHATNRTRATMSVTFEKVVVDKRSRGGQEEERKVEHAPHDPKIIRPVPRPPEPKRRVIIRDATDHVFRRVDPVQERPEAEETPREE